MTSRFAEIVSERSATKTLKPWDRVAMRIVDVRGKSIIGGGLLPFALEPSERLIAAIGSVENQGSADIPTFIAEVGVDKNDPEVDLLIGTATNKTELLRNLAPAFSLYFLEDMLDRIVDPAVLQLTNSDGEDMEFMRLVYRLAESVTPEHIHADLNRTPDLAAASGTV